MKGENLGYLDQGLGTSLANIGTGYGNARDALYTNVNAAAGNVDNGYRDATAALGTARGDLTSGYNNAQGFLTSGAGAARDAFGQARTDLTGAVGSFDDLAGLGKKYGQATSLYQDSLGVNGAEGAGRANAAFMPSSAYTFNRDQGLESINRARNARGMANSGNTDRDAQEYGAGLASREVGGWQDRLQGFINPELAATSGAASGRAGAFTNLGNLGVRQADMESTLGRDSAGLATGYGTNTANLGVRGADLATGRGAMLAGLADSYGRNLAGSYTGEANTLAGLNTGAANARVGVNNTIMSPYINSYENAAKASMEGTKNIWGAGLEAAKLAASFSDRRLKDDITEIGKLYDGTPVYSFRYKGEARTQIGLMAQDVEKFAPDAVFEVNGFKMVDYRKATERARASHHG